MIDVDASAITSAERVARLESALEELPATPDGGCVLVGGEEASLLWDATVDSFSSGVWVATILCTQARHGCTRFLAGASRLRPGRAKGLGEVHVRTQGWVPKDVHDEVAVLCEARKPYGHFRRPVDAGTIGRDVAEALKE
jgi:hypothetical protein